MIVTIVTGLLQPCGNTSKPYAVRVSMGVLPLLPPFCENIRSMYTTFFSHSRKGEERLKRKNEW
jgi:hypothetical protein